MMICITAHILDSRAAQKPTGLKGTARFVRHLREVRKELLTRGWGPYWGVFKGKLVLSEIESSSAQIGPSGSGKSTCAKIPLALSLTGRSKVILDFKSDETPILKKFLERYENIRVLNLGGLHHDEVGGQFDHYILKEAGDRGVGY
ncbi:MAG: hypothetical protein AAF986_06050 [Pseudomonadota bacterium]